MKKIIYLVAIFVFLMASVSPAVASPWSDDPQPDPAAPADVNTIYLPIVIPGAGVSASVQGRITVNAGTLSPVSLEAVDTSPLAGVTLTDDDGKTVTTDANGRFNMTVRKGSQLTPSKAGYYFNPRSITVNGSLTNSNFTGTNAVASAAVMAPEAVLIPNPGFEYVPYYWNPISGNAAGFTPFYTSARAYQGTYSGFTGIPYGWYTYQESWSRWRTHEIVIPATATTADLRFFIWPDSEEALALPAPSADEQTLAAELEALVGWDTEDVNLPAITQDFQYVAVIDPVTNVILGYLYSGLRDDRTWLDSGLISLLAYAGQTVKLEFGTVNDGDGYESRAYFDEFYVFVDLAGAVTCTNVLLNSDMELGIGSGWTNTVQNVPPVTSFDYFWSPLASIKAGTAPWEVEPPYVSTTEFYQTVSIPADATYARLRMMVLPKSTGWTNWWSAAGEANLRTTDDLAASRMAPLAPDQRESQYAYLADPTSLEGVVLLFKYLSVDSLNWLARSYDLMSFRNTTFAVLFGVGDMTATKTSLFVDDVYLDVCTPDAVAAPAP